MYLYSIHIFEAKPQHQTPANDNAEDLSWYDGGQ